MLEKWLPSRRSGNLPRSSGPENMLDIFEDMWNRPFRGFEEFSNKFTPSVEVSEKENEIVVRAEIPGLDPKDIDLSVENNNLILRGEKKREKNLEPQ